MKFFFKRFSKKKVGNSDSPYIENATYNFC